MRRKMDAKREGELGELRFAVEAMGRGLRLYQPYGDSAPYDFIVDGAAGLKRVQVRSVWFKSRFYHVPCMRTLRRKAYTKREIDAVAAYVAPEDLWYLVPVEALKGRRGLYLWPHSKQSRGLWEGYREKWEVLGGENVSRWQRSKVPRRRRAGGQREDGV